MGRHKEEGSAITHVRVSPESKQRLEELKKKNSFATIDQVIKYYLSSDTDYMIRRYITLDDKMIANYIKQQQQPTPEDIANYVKQSQLTEEDINNYVKQQQDSIIVDKLIKDASKELTQYINKHSPNHYSTRTKQSLHKPKWRKHKPW